VLGRTGAPRPSREQQPEPAAEAVEGAFLGTADGQGIDGRDLTRGSQLDRDDYYATQLAQHAIMAASRVPIVANEIEVTHLAVGAQQI
jgi:hypothetical protein